MLSIRTQARTSKRKKKQQCTGADGNEDDPDMSLGEVQLENVLDEDEILPLMNMSNMSIKDSDSSTSESDSEDEINVSSSEEQGSDPLR